MRLEKTVYQRIAFVVGLRQLEGLDRILGRAGSSVDYDVEFTDGTSCKCAGLRELLEAMEGPNRHAKKLMARTPYSDALRASATLNAQEWLLPCAEFSVSGEASVTTAVAEELKDWLGEVRQSYTRVTHFPGGLFIPAILGGLVTALASAAAYARLSAAFAAVVSAGVFPLMWLFFLLNRWLFPIGLFAVGAGEGRAKQLADWRMIVLVGVGLTGIVMPLLLKWIF